MYDLRDAQVHEYLHDSSCMASETLSSYMILTCYTLLFCRSSQSSDFIEFYVPNVSMQPAPVVQSKKKNLVDVTPESNKYIGVGDVLKIVLRLVNDSNQKVGSQHFLL